MSKWIDIDDQTPQEDFEVIVCVGDDVFLSTYRVEEYDSFFDCELEDGSDCIIQMDKIVTHWMPLPVPPHMECVL